MANDNVIPSAVGDIHVPGNRSSSSIDTSIEFTPQNPFTMDTPTNLKSDADVAYPGYPIEPEKTGELESAKAEFEESADIRKILHAANAPLREPASSVVQNFYPDVNDKFYHPAPDGWSPKQEIDKLPQTVDPKYLPKLLNTKNPDDFNYQMQSINDDATRSAELQNGSTLGKILGGAIGYTLGSIENFIPLAALATKAKVASGFISGAMRTAPGAIAAATIHEGANQMDKVDGNLPDFLKDTFIDSAFGVTLFGGFGAAKTLVNVAELNSIKTFARNFLDGIGADFNVSKEGNLVGFKAVDTTGGSVSAAKLSRAQEQFDAAFYKGGLFKVPYVGEIAANVLSGNLGNLPGVRNVDWARKGFNYLLGSPLVQVMTSDYKAANAFGNSAFDHYITTIGDMKGETRAPSFESKVKKTRAMITSLGVETDALRAERNEYSITARPTINIQNAWNAVKQKSIETFSKESNSTDWVSKDDFMDEVSQVRMSGVQSEHAAVNKAAALYDKVFQDTGNAYLAAYNLPKDYFRNMDSYISRVYNTPYMQENEGVRGGKDGFVPVIANYYKQADEMITQRMQPIHDLQTNLKEAKASHSELLKQPNLSNDMVKTSSDRIDKIANDLKYAKEKLQNELRSNPEYDYHIDDRHALSADEARELTKIQKPLNAIKKQVTAQQKIVSDLKNLKAKSQSSAMKGKTVETATKHADAEAAHAEQVKVEEEKLNELKRNQEDEEYNLYDKARNNEINPRLYNPLTHELKDPNNRLKFRDVYKSHGDRETAAKASYDSIMSLTPQDIIADMFGKISGNAEANPLKQRTLMVPDEVLFNNNFLSKNLYAKTANYVNFLSKRTHLKTSFNNVTVNGNFEELATDLLDEYQSRREAINQKIETLTDPKEIAAQKKLLKKEGVKFGEIKGTMKTLFETRMMGINRRGPIESGIRRAVMSLAAASNLHNLPATQITDLAWGGYQHGLWPYIRDGIYPILESLGGILKTKDAEALREMAPHVNLGYQDAGNNYADRNWHSELQPDINMGKIVSGIEKFAHFSAVTDLSPYIDNGIQRAHASVIQSRFMELLHKHLDGTLKPKESLYLRKYGIDPKIWSQRMVDAYKEAGGFKTKLGGYMSKAWQWQDLEAANTFNDAVFRGVQNTLVWKGMADSPFFADNILGMFFHTFTGWTYAATNRYLIPSMQHPDGELLLKMMLMLGAGAMVSPMRRISRGEDPIPQDMTPEQHSYEVFQDSGVLSSMGNVIALANFMSDDKLLGNLKNDKYKNRVKTGMFGIPDVVSSTASHISDVLGMANHGLDEKDLKTAAHMLPISGAMYGHYFSDKLIEGLNLPRNKQAASNS